MVIKDNDKIVRYIKIFLIAVVALYFFIVVLNNLTDYGSNYAFVQHVISMDTTFEGNNLMWRAINCEVGNHIFYWIIIVWEALACLLCGFGAWIMWRNVNNTGKRFNDSKKVANKGLCTSLLLWFLAFITIGGEWFVMWQSPIWNGQQAAFRMFVIMGIILILNIHKDD